MWSIRFLSGNQSGQVSQLKLGKNTLGRGSNCDIQVQSVGISKLHCEIHVYKDKLMILDLKSSNGTFVNGVKIQNSILNLGDKLSLFDVIMDIIPSPEARPPSIKSEKKQSPVVKIKSTQSLVQKNQSVLQKSFPSQDQLNQDFLMENQKNINSTQNINSSGSPTLLNSQSQLKFSEKLDNFIEQMMMPFIYKLSFLLPFKQVLLGFVIIYIIMITLLSLIPLSTITKESNFNEASKRAKSVARALARLNEAALLSNQYSSLNVSEALKEDGIKEALIIQQSDGAIIAPSEKAGRESSKPFITNARKELKSIVGMIDSNTIGAAHPIGIYDSNTGESMVKYHAIIYYDISSLGVDQGRIISLFMQTLIIASLFGILLFIIFSRLIQFPLVALNKQIDQALLDKTDRTEILFDYPEFQKTVVNVNLILNRLWNGLANNNEIKPLQNRDLEFSNIVDMISQPALVISQSGIVVALNSQFEQLSQMSKESLVQQNYSIITDPALMQNIQALIARSLDAPFEKHSDKIPFSQFECEIFVQAQMNLNSEPEYFFMTLAKVEGSA